jgi:hypothetical protein
MRSKWYHKAPPNQLDGRFPIMSPEPMAPSASRYISAGMKRRGSIAEIEAPE